MPAKTTAGHRLENRQIPSLPGGNRLPLCPEPRCATRGSGFSVLSHFQRYDRPYGFEAKPEAGTDCRGPALLMPPVVNYISDHNA